MAQNMKIAIITPAGEKITIDINENELFREFQTRILHDYNISVVKEQFTFDSTTFEDEDNLYYYLKKYLNIENEDICDVPLFEINLHQDDIKTETTPDLNLDINNENYLKMMDLHPDQNNTEFNPETIFELDKIDKSLLKGNDATELKLLESSQMTEKIINPPIPADSSYNYLDIESKLREMHDYSDESVLDVCRLCAETLDKDNKINIADVENKIEDLNQTLPIKIDKFDGLPQQLCRACDERFKVVSDFVKIVLQADKTLRMKFKPSTESTDQVSNKNSSAKEFLSEFLSVPTNTETDIETLDEVTDSIEYLNDKTESTNLLSCRICDFQLSTPEEGIEHSITHHLNEKYKFYQCSFCDITVLTTDLLKHHVRTKHTKTRLFQCNYCSKKYISDKQLHKHTCAPVINNSTLHCEICNQAFPTKIRLNFHRQFHLKDARPMYCTLCSKKFRTEDEFFDHVYFQHESQQIYACRVCGKEFSVRSELMKHKRVHSELQAHKCEICFKKFLYLHTLKEHEVTHMKQTPYQCHVCGKHLNRLSRLRKHLLTHESDPVLNDVFVCNLCNEAFANAQIAEQHRAEVHGRKICIKTTRTDRVFRCEFCEKCFCIAEALNKHRIIHTGPNPYSCHLCDAQFCTFARCTTHKTTHGIYKENAEKDSFPVVKHFLCEQCGKSYLHWSYLSCHRKLKHSDHTNTYKCYKCGLQFPTSWFMAYHRKTIHNIEQLKCPDCQQILTNQQSLKIHRLTQHAERVHKGITNFQCMKCDKIFIQQSSLDAHSKLHNDAKDYKCKLCPDKSFTNVSSLAKHMKTHKDGRTQMKIQQKEVEENCVITNTTERPFSCNQCGLTFKRLFTLRNHQKKHTDAQPKSSFVLMVDLHENCMEEEEDTPKKQKVNQPENVYLQLEPGQNLSDSYIDMGNGNYLKLIGNSVNIVGNEPIINVPVAEEQPLVLNELIAGQQYEDNNTVMLVEPKTSSFVINQGNDLSQFVFTTDNTSRTSYIVDNDNQFVFKADNNY